MTAPETDRVPASTYRFQIRSSFDLHDAERRLPYLHDLGVDWVYLSPLLEAEPGSDHGYDVVRHDRIDPTRGGPEGLAAVSAEARRLGMGVLVDVVPNHVGVATPQVNPWWWDLLRHGRDSRYAEAFDVDWEVASGKVRIPVLGDDGLDAVVVDPGAPDGGVVRYHDNVYPLAPGTTALTEQHYELVHWTAADHGLNYRRFFAINTLAAVRVEVPWVFEETHAEVRRWFEEGLVDGLRIDHPDGLFDPVGYLDDLAALTGGAYVLVEKILETGEELATSWATTGTTGYDALALVDRVLTDPAAEAALPAGSDSGLDYHGLVHDTKRAVADQLLGSEVRRVVRDVASSVAHGESPGEVMLEAEVLEDAVAELAACFPTYRSYLPDRREDLDAALADARARRPDLAGALDALAPVLADPEHPAALRFQQTTGAVMAKGVEDCAFYRFNRLTSLTEVGGDPSTFSVGVDAFHAAMAHRQATWPTAMTTTTTHDTKRGEDVRARIAVLAEVPQLWTEALAQLQSLAPVPSQAFASLLWQAVLGAWVGDDPDLRARLHAYAEKAMREAGDHTTWTQPDQAFEDAVHAAVDAAFDSAEVAEVLRGLLDATVEPGWVNALSAKLLALAIPGVPDVYQGSELWEQSLVDPDNRRPVDLDLRAALLADPALEHDARAKLDLVAAVLRLRRDRPESFSGYTPVGAEGEAAGHVMAFDRGGVIAVATRLPVGLAARGGWGATRLSLPPGAWTDVLTGRVTDGGLADLLDTHPVAVLVREQS